MAASAGQQGPNRPNFEQWIETKVRTLDSSVMAGSLPTMPVRRHPKSGLRIRASTGISYILISHDLAVIRQITQTCVVMQNGRIVERGLSSDILDAPHAEYTKMLRASVPVPGWKPSRRMSGQSAGDLAEV